MKPPAPYIVRDQASRAQPITHDQLRKLRQRYTPDFPKLRWMDFLEAMLAYENDGVRCRLYRAKTTVSKYIYIQRKDRIVKVRFSNHFPANAKVAVNDADYYVGVSPKGCMRTEQVIPRVLTDLGIQVPISEL